LVISLLTAWVGFETSPEGKSRNAGQESDSPAAAVYGIETKHYKFCCHTPHAAKTAMTNVQLHYIAD